VNPQRPPDADADAKMARMRAARAFCREFLAGSAHAAMFAHLRRALALDDAAIEAAYLHYAFQSYAADNDIYASVATHVAMLIEYLTPRSIHDDRQAQVVEQLMRMRPRRIADIGFGAPTRYLSAYALPDPGVSVLMLDKYPAAVDVGRALVGYLESSGAPHIAARVAFGLHDMDADPCPAGYDGYLFQDAIEHAREPARYLRQAVAVAAPGAAMLFQIPIGPIIPSHYMAWHDAAQAVAWLEAAGLVVELTRTLLPNPAVDWFAVGDAPMQNLFVAARKGS